MTARDEILDAIQELTSRSNDGSFTIGEVVALMHARGTQYAESTIRTHVSSRMCASAPDHHLIVFQDLTRIGPGRYRLR
jgi:hypothetical protein